MSTAIILQARMGSRRLPGKVLARVGSRTLLDHCLYRLSAGGLPVIVATSTRADDDAVEFEARRFGAQVYRGDHDDVLARVIGAARTFDVSTIIRATADNPFVDGDSPRRVLDLVEHVRADHVIERGLPVGAAVELVTLEALIRSQSLITDPYDREHVTSFVRRDTRFQALRAVAPAGVRRPGLRLTVDTEHDLEFARAVVAGLAGEGELSGLAAVIRVADALLVRTVLADRSRAERKGA